MPSKYLGKLDKFKAISKVKTDVYNIPIVYAKSGDNGIMYWAKENDFTVYKNILSIIYNGAIAAGLVYAQSENTGILAESYFIRLKNYDVDFKVNLFLQRVLEKVLYPKYSREYLATWLGKVENDIIKLPIKNNKIDFEFMENFIVELEKEQITQLEAYLLASDLKDYTLTKEEKKVLEDFDDGMIEWEEYIIYDLFEKLNLKTLKKTFNKLHDTSTVQTDEFNLPLLNAKFGNNGIMFYGREKDFDSAEMTIDVISNGAIATGTVYAQPYKTGVLWDAYLLRAKVKAINKQKLLYLTTSLEKSIKKKFGWDNKAVWSKVQHQIISLPTKNKHPNYELMETLISAIQKLVIKDVVLYVDKKRLK